MQPKSPVNAVAVKKEEKEAKLREFVAGYLASATVVALTAEERTLLLVARSCDSPVVAALRGMQADLAQHGFAVYLILAAELDDRRLAPLSSLGWDVRCLNDIRYLDAHEQLVLGPEAAWIGDCMRREPLKRDAFEIYAAACAQTAGYGLRSFRQLWQAGRSLEASKSIAAADRAADAATTCAVVATMAEQAADAADAPKAMTRQ